MQFPTIIYALRAFERSSLYDLRRAILLSRFIRYLTSNIDVHSKSSNMLDDVLLGEA